MDRNVARENKDFNRLTFGEDGFFFSFLIASTVLAKQSAKIYRVLPIYVTHRYPLLHRGCSVMHGRDKARERDGTMLAVSVLFSKYDKTGRFDSRITITNSKTVHEWRSEKNFGKFNKNRRK